MIHYMCDTESAEYNRIFPLWQKQKGTNQMFYTHFQITSPQVVFRLSLSSSNSTHDNEINAFIHVLDKHVLIFSFWNCFNWPLLTFAEDVILETERKKERDPKHIRRGIPFTYIQCGQFSCCLVLLYHCVDDIYILTCHDTKNSLKPTKINARERIDLQLRCGQARYRRIAIMTQQV